MECLKTVAEANRALEKYDALSDFYKAEYKCDIIQALCGNCEQYQPVDGEKFFTLICNTFVFDCFIDGLEFIVLDFVERPSLPTGPNGGTAVSASLLQGYVLLDVVSTLTLPEFTLIAHTLDFDGYTADLTLRSQDFSFSEMSNFWETKIETRKSFSELKSELAIFRIEKMADHILNVALEPVEVCFNLAKPDLQIELSSIDDVHLKLRNPKVFLAGWAQMSNDTGVSIDAGFSTTGTETRPRLLPEPSVKQLNLLGCFDMSFADVDVAPNNNQSAIWTSFTASLNGLFLRALSISVPFDSVIWSVVFCAQADHLCRTLPKQDGAIDGFKSPDAEELIKLATHAGPHPLFVSTVADHGKVNLQGRSAADLVFKSAGQLPLSQDQLSAKAEMDKKLYTPVANEVVNEELPRDCSHHMLVPFEPESVVWH